jgi:hypothetical protein
MAGRIFQSGAAGGRADARSQLLWLLACLPAGDAGGAKAAHYKSGDKADDAGCRSLAGEEADGRVGIGSGAGAAGNGLLGNGNIKAEISSTELPAKWIGEFVLVLSR